MGDTPPQGHLGTPGPQVPQPTFPAAPDPTPTPRPASVQISALVVGFVLIALALVLLNLPQILWSLGPGSEVAPPNEEATRDEWLRLVQLDFDVRERLATTYLIVLILLPLGAALIVHAFGDVVAFIAAKLPYTDSDTPSEAAGTVAVMMILIVILAVAGFYVKPWADRPGKVARSADEYDITARRNAWDRARATLDAQEDKLAAYDALEAENIAYRNALQMFANREIGMMQVAVQCGDDPRRNFLQWEPDNNIDNVMTGTLMEDVADKSGDGIPFARTGWTYSVKADFGDEVPRLFEVALLGAPDHHDVIWLIKFNPETADGAPIPSLARYCARFLGSDETVAARSKEFQTPEEQAALETLQSDRPPEEPQ